MGACSIYHVARMMTIDPDWLAKRIEEHRRNGNREMLAAALAAQLRFGEMQRAKAAGLTLRELQDLEAAQLKAALEARRVERAPIMVDNWPVKRAEVSNE